MRIMKLLAYVARVTGGMTLGLLALGLVQAATPAVPKGAEAQVQNPAPDSDRYIIGPGDMLQVFVWQNEDLSTTVPVLPDGRVSTPLAEGVVAAGKTTAQVARDIETALSEFVRSPKVSVQVSQPRSSFSQVKAVGEFRQPQALPFTESMTVLDAVLLAGGVTEFAAGNRAKVVRKVNGKEQEIKVRIKDMMKGDMKTNIVLKAGDIIVVPQTFL
jgi:polysaccharide export outer membrane protein